MEEELAVLREAMEQMKREITLVAAESLALQYILTMMASKLGQRVPAHAADHPSSLRQRG